MSRLRPSRRGVAAVELAVCLPVLVLLVFCSIEACSMIFVKQSLAAASYEAARLATKQTADRTDVLAAAETILNARDIRGADVTLTPNDPGAADRGTDLLVTITAPSDVNSALLGRFLPARQVTASCFMVKE